MTATSLVAAPDTATGPERLHVLHGVGDLADLLGVRFSDEQLAAVTAPLEPGVIVAGAGSGKTTVMAARVVWLVGTGQVPPGQVLGLTFTNKAAAELATKLRSRLQELAVRAGQRHLLDERGEPTVSTYHSYAGSLLGEHGLRLGHEADLRVVSDATRYQLAARAVTTFRGPREHLSVSLPSLVGQVICLDNELCDHLVDVQTVRDFGVRQRRELDSAPDITEVRETRTRSLVRDELLDLVVAYRQAKADAGVSEFADQMARGAELGLRCPEVGVAERDRFAVVLLDEYQDTSVSQRLMLQGLFGDAAAPSGRGHPVTAVGDPCQAIYGWRGAAVDNIDCFPEHFRCRDGSRSRRFALTVNRRCARRVLDAANDLAGSLYDVHAGVRPLVARDHAPPGRLRVTLHETVVDEVAAAVDDVERLGTSFRTDGTGSWSDVAVLVRDGNERSSLAAGLRSRGVPVEVVGLSGLLLQPEVADVVATLRCVSSLTANADLLRLLTGPRWRIGARDLALLGGRAAELTPSARCNAAGLRARLDGAVRGVDPTEVVSLSDALDDPGSGDFSVPARGRFAALSAELTTLRHLAGEPLVDLVRRVVEVLGLDVELATAPGPESDLARDNLARFVDVVADFGGTDRSAGLFGLLGYLDAELAHNQGMELADPGAADSVKLLTVHTAKGLEWRAVVLPFLSDGVFPTRNARPRWECTASAVPVPLRGDRRQLPRLASWTKADRSAYIAAQREHQLLEERRLAYVAVTRAQEMVVASGHRWGRTQQTARGPSPYLETLREHAAAAGSECAFAAAPPDDATNPLLAQQLSAAFPGRLDEQRLARRRSLAADVRRAMAAEAADGTGRAPGDPPGVDLAAVDDEIDTLLAEVGEQAADTVLVDLPASVSATTALRAHTDPDGLARELVRPMPRRPSSAAGVGTRFHAWVETRFGQQLLLDPTELPGRADGNVDDDLQSLIEAFRAGPFAERRPCAIEAPFQLVLGGQLVRGRIDAVYAGDDGGFEVVDWKTNRRRDADPLQLAIYRLAWAELDGVPLQRVRAAFYYVRSGEVVTHDDLPGRAALEDELFGGLSGRAQD